MVFFMRFLIQIIQEESPDPWRAAYLLSVFTSVLFLGFLLRHAYAFHTYTFILVMRKSTTALLYKKLLRLSQNSLVRITPATIINLSSGDISSLEKSFQFVPLIFISPALFLVCISLVASLVGNV